MQDKLIMLQNVSLLQVSNYKLQKEVGIINGSWWDLIDYQRKKPYHIFDLMPEVFLVWMLRLLRSCWIAL